MKLKKYLSLLAALVLCFTTLAGIWSAAAEEEIKETETAAGQANDTGMTEEEAEIEYPDELRVGHTTITKGDFFTEMFGNNTADIDVRALIHGYNLVNWDQNQGTYLIDEAVVEDVLLPIARELGFDFTLEELRTFETRRKLRNARPDLPIPEDEEIDDDPVPFWLLDRGWTYDTDVYPDQLPEKE